MWHSLKTWLAARRRSKMTLVPEEWYLLAAADQSLKLATPQWLFRIIGLDAAERIIQASSREELDKLVEITRTHERLQRDVDDSGEYFAARMAAFEEAVLDYFRHVGDSQRLTIVAARIREFREQHGIPDQDSADRSAEMARTLAERKLPDEERHQRLMRDLPTFQRLWDFHQTDVQRAEAGDQKVSDAWFEIALGLGHFKRRYYRQSSPINVETFGGTGGDGTHFSLLRLNGRLTEESPVVVTLPGNAGEENRVVARNLRDFLALGMCRGFMAVEEFAYGREVQLDQPSDLSSSSRDVLRRLANELKLPPLEKAVARIAASDAQYRPLLKMCFGYDDRILPLDSEYLAAC